MARTLLSAVLAATLFNGPMIGQEHPDLSGTWLLDVEQLDLPPSIPKALIIIQGPERLTVEFERANASEPPLVLNYELVAPGTLQAPVTESVKAGDSTLVLEANAEWKDDHIETFAVFSINGRTVTYRTLFVPDPTEQTLTLDTYLMVQHGYQDLDGPSHGEYVYRRAAH